MTKPKLLNLPRAWREDPNQGVNPDEVVAIGAAVQGAVYKVM